MARKYVLISYAHSDAAFVSRLTKRLDQLNLQVWRDIDRINGGDDWKESIDAALRNSSAVILVLSEASAKSQYVTYEWAFALGAGVKVIPIRRSIKIIHPRLADIQYIDFTQSGKPWLRLVDALTDGIVGNKDTGLRIHAQFEMEGGKPVMEDESYVILLEIKGNLGGGSRARYHVHDETFTTSRWSVSNPREKFSTWMTSYGDVPLSVEILGHRTTRRVESTLYKALSRTYAKNRNPHVRRALEQIRTE